MLLSFGTVSYLPKCLGVEVDQFWIGLERVGDYICGLVDYMLYYSSFRTGIVVLTLPALYSVDLRAAGLLPVRSVSIFLDPSSRRSWLVYTPSLALWPGRGRRSGGMIEEERLVCDRYLSI